MTIMNDQPGPGHNSQSGNLFFYIFMAVILFGALSFVVAQSGRGSVQSMAGEQARLNAIEIIDYSDAASKAVGTLRLRGTSLAQLRFSNAQLSAANYDPPNAANARNEVFNAEGGGIVYRAPPRQATTVTTPGYDFIGNVAVRNIGTTCAASTCSELMMIVPNVNADVCRILNVLLNVHKRTDDLPVEAAFDATGFFKGAMAYTDQIGDEADSGALDGKSAGCFEDSGTSTHYFYRVLWAQ